MRGGPAGYGSDLTCLGKSAGAASTRFPGALFRGGVFAGGTDAGPFAVIGFNLPSDSAIGIRFRGAR